MLPVLITIDTEYSSGLFGRGMATDWRENFAQTIACKNGDDEAGIFYQMDIFDRYGLKGVFFVDPLPALIWGQESVDAIVKPILERGHEVQLHLHSEWLEFTSDNLVGGRTGWHIKDFSFADQKILIEKAAHILVRAGADFPIAFRAGNYGANDDTLKALDELNILYDSSHAPGFPTSDCEINLTEGDHHPVEKNGIVEVPIASISCTGNSQRHCQITALSVHEMKSAIKFAKQAGWSNITLVSHSFEMFNRTKLRENKIIMRRFEKLCEWIAKTDGVDTATFASLHNNGMLQPQKQEYIGAQLMPHNPILTAHRIAEQLIANRLYR